LNQFLNKTCIGIVFRFTQKVVLKGEVSTKIFGVFYYHIFCQKFKTKKKLKKAKIIIKKKKRFGMVTGLELTQEEFALY
jgi:predicted RNA-binding protein with PUA domain